MDEMRSHNAAIEKQNAAFQARMEAFLTRMQETPSFLGSSAPNSSMFDDDTIAPDEDTC